MSTVNLTDMRAESLGFDDDDDDYGTLARNLAEAMRWTRAGSRAVPFPKGLVVQQWRVVIDKGRKKGRSRLCTLLVQGVDEELTRGNTAWPMLKNEDTARVLSSLATRSYGVRFTRSDTGVWVVNDTPTIPGAGLVFACDPHLGVVAAHALIECVRAERQYKEKLNIRLSMGLPA